MGRTADKTGGARTAGCWRQDTVNVDGKGSTRYTYQERPDGVLIVPITAEGMVLLIRQYRYAMDAWGLEVPAGGTQDTEDMAFGSGPEGTSRGNR